MDKKPAAEMPHLGQLLNKIMDEKHYTQVNLAQQIGKSANTVKGYTIEPSLHARILWNLSIALGFDFFEYLSLALNANPERQKQEQTLYEKQEQMLREKTEHIARLEQQIQLLEKEVSIYRDILKR